MITTSGSGVKAAATRQARSVSMLVSDAWLAAPSGWTCKSVSWQISILVTLLQEVQLGLLDTRSLQHIGM